MKQSLRKLPKPIASLQTKKDVVNTIRMARLSLEAQALALLVLIFPASSKDSKTDNLQSSISQTYLEDSVTSLREQEEEEDAEGEDAIFLWMSRLASRSQSLALRVPY